MATLPILLKDPHILLIGGGPVGLQKAKVLQDNQVRFKLIAREFLPDFAELGLDGEITTRELDTADLKDAHIVIDATGNPRVAALLDAEKQHRFLLVNRVDDPENSDFFFAALLNYGRLKIAVSTDGASPTISQAVRDRIREVLPASLTDLVEQAAEQRSRGLVDVKSIRRAARTRMALVDLVGCGPGDVGLLTLEARNCLEQAEVVLYDHLISPEILALVPDHTEKLYVGKRKQAHSLKQDTINRLILDHVRQGKQVARLKSGHPYIFGRGAEEAAFLAEQGVRVRVLDGVSSAIAAPAAAGIPLTARGYATNVSIVSAHLAGSHLNTDWLPLLRLPNHTTVVLMGLSFVREIVARALPEGVPADTPVAIVSNGTRSSQQTIITTLQDLGKDAERAERPAVLVFGEVVTLHRTLPHKK